MNKDFTPFIGARPFTTSDEDRQRFSGRFFETNRIVSYIYSHPVTLIYAPSGAGKTSLINASVIPVLKQKLFQVFPPARVQNVVANKTIPDVPNQYIFNILLRMSDSHSAEELANETLVSFLQKQPIKYDNTNRELPKLIVIDQFEEIFNVPAENWKQQQDEFFTQIRQAIDSNPLLRIVFLIREEYVGQLESFGKFLPEEFRIRFRLGPLSKENAIKALSKPLEDTPRKFADGVAEKIVNDMSMVRWTTNNKEVKEVEGNSIEPVHLQLVGATLWSNLPDDVTTIETRHVRQYGDVDNILKDYYETAINSIIHTSTIKQKLLRNWFDTKLITPIGTRSIVFRDSSTTQGLANNIVEQLTDRHILRGEDRAGGRWYELTHDRWVQPIKNSNSIWRRTKAKQQQKRIVSGLSGALLIGAVGAPVYYNSLFLNPSLVPPPRKNIVSEMKNLPTIDYGNFKILRDIRILDFRSRRKLKFWQHKHGDKYSPVTWMRYSLAKKINLNAQSLIFKFGTSGYGVFPRSLSHEYELQVSINNLKLHPNKKLREVWHVVTDVSKEKDNEFLAVTEATFWNAFQGTKEWASITSADISTKEIGVSLIFPEKNEYRNIKLYKNSHKTKKRTVIAETNSKLKNCEKTHKKPEAISDRKEILYWVIGNCRKKMETGKITYGNDNEIFQFFGADNNRTVFWSIKKPSLEYRYDVSWEWDKKLNWWERSWWDKQFKD